MTPFPILLIGSGARESALGRCLALSPSCQRLYAAPGTLSTSEIGLNVDLDLSQPEKVAHWCVDRGIGLVVVGPEAPLVAGVADTLRSYSIPVLGPGADGARLEGSKDWAKAFMTHHHVPTARYRSFTAAEAQRAHHYLDHEAEAPYVLKADGLAGGKGVIIAQTLPEAHAALDEMFAGQFGQASSRVVIEQFLKGRECSVFVLTDGKGSYRVLPVARDYKRRHDGDQGPNTGGMGSVSPVGWADKAFMDKVTERVIWPTLDGLSREGIDYRGFIFLGLMEVDGDPYVIEYNVRMGDPETQSALLRVCGDFADVCRRCAQGHLAVDVPLGEDPRAAVTVVLVTDTYPASCAKGMEVTGLDNLADDVVIFHAGTYIDAQGVMRASGGRVLSVSALAPTVAEARALAYAAADTVSWDGRAFRTDIAQ